MSRRLHAVTAPTGAAVLDTFLPALAAALDGAGPALLPLPAAGGRDSLLAALRPDLPLEDDAVALVVPTSGSTGEPKGAMLRADAVRASAQLTHDRLGGPGQWLLALPVTHIAGLQVLVRSLEARARPVVLDLYGGFDPAAFGAAARQLTGQRRYTALVPTQLRRLLDADVDLGSFDAVLVGADMLPEDLRQRCAERSWPVVETYGMTETSGGCVYDGTPLDAVTVDLRDDGRIVLGGPTLFGGYRLRPDNTAAVLVDGRFVTQDLGRWRPDGRLEVLGRVDDVILTGGVTVAATAVERVLAAHPGVAGCAVVGRPDEQWGERVVAVVQPAHWHAVPTLEELRAFAATRLDREALPRELIVVGMLPMLPSGKPDKLAVRSLVAARATRPHVQGELQEDRHGDRG